MVRLFVESDLSVGASVDVSPEQAHYLVRVMRLGVGDALLLFNGRSGEWRGIIERIDKRKALLSAIEQVRPQPAEHDAPSGPWLAFAPVKKTGTDFIIQKATELGVRRLLPVRTANSQTDRANLQRWRANAVEAAEQCGRMDVPQVDGIVDLAALIENWPHRRRLFMLDETGSGVPFRKALSGPEMAQSDGCGFLVGPEGGFQANELDWLSGHKFITTVTLGPRILRAETACLSALAAWQAVAGDW